MECTNHAKTWKNERDSRKRSSSAGSEKMERVGGREEKMEGLFSTGQSPQWAVVPMEEEEEEEEEEEKKNKNKNKNKNKKKFITCYSLATGFNLCRGHPQGKLQDYKKSQSVTMHK